MPSRERSRSWGGEPTLQPMGDATLNFTTSPCCWVEMVALGTLPLTPCGLSQSGYFLVVPCSSWGNPLTKDA